MTTTVVSSTNDSTTGLAWLGAVGFFIVVVAWSLAIPFHGAPDEFTHLYLVEYLYLHSSIPSPGIDPVDSFIGVLSGWTITKDEFWYFGLPYLHSLGATATAWMFAGLLPDQMGYLAARAFNWLLAPVFAFSLISIGQMSGLRGGMAVLVAVLFLLVPQATFLFSYFNADAFALTVTTLSLAFFLRALRGPNGWKPFLFGISCGLVLCSKIYFYPSLVFFAGSLVFHYLASRALPIGRFMALSLSGAALIAVPVLTTTYSHFGEVLGLGGQALFTELHKGDTVVPCYIFCTSGLINTNNLTDWLGLALMSYFFGLGWMNIFLPYSAYLLFYFPLVCVLFLASIFLSCRKIFQKRSEGIASLWVPFITLLFWGMTFSVLLLNIIGSQNLMPQPQGRYLYVTFPFALFLLSSLIASWSDRSPARSHSDVI